MDHDASARFIHVVDRLLKLLAPARSALVGLGLLLLIPVLALAIGQVMDIHPPVTRQQAIKAAMEYGRRQPYPRVEAKYMRYRDLLKADTGLGIGTDGTDYFVWVVAVSGDYGLSPSGPCCYVRPPTTWGIAVVKDGPGTPKATTFQNGVNGDWPPFFDSLPDLAKDRR